MDLFVQALRGMDVAGFLALFSRSEPWYYVNTLVEPAHVDTVSYSRLARDLRDKTGLYETLFEFEDLDTFRDNVMIDIGEPWRRVGESTFIPPHLDEDDWVYVRWRKEGRRWVVDAIADPSA